MTARMRVLMVASQLPTPDHPGSMAPLVRQIASLRAAGLAVDVLEIRGARRLKYVQSLPALWAAARSVDVVHAHFGYSGWVARSQFQKPVVVSFMGDDLLGTPGADGRITTLSRLVVEMDRWLARTADAVIVKSAEMARVVAPVRAHVVPNGVDLDAFRPIDRTEAKRSLGLSENTRHVLFAGNPDFPGKGFALAQAAVANARSGLTVPLALVAMWGVAPERVPLYMNACDVLLLTSLSEGSPNVVKEALACDLPVVSVPVGDVPDVLSGVPGCFVCPRDVDHLSQALIAVVSGVPRVDGRSALVRKGLDLESVARRIVAIYDAILSRSQGQRC